VFCQTRDKCEATQFFANSHLHIPDVMKFLITYAEGWSLYHCSQIAGVGYGSMAVDLASFCRDLFTEYYVRHVRDEQFSGEVKIDESLFGRRTKHHRGDPRGIKVWIFGIVERQTNRLKVFPIDTIRQERHSNSYSHNSTACSTWNYGNN